MGPVGKNLPPVCLSDSTTVGPCCRCCRRLSCLCALNITIEGTLNSLALGVVLSSINTQLPQLRSLALTAKHSWTGAEAVRAQLGQATQLTRPAVGFDRAVGLGAHLKDLAPLSSLTGLQQLNFLLANKGAQLQPAEVDSGDAQFLAHLTALTELQGDFMLKPGMLQHISNCTALQSWSMQVGFLVQPSSSDWQVLGELTRLTKLQVARCMVRDQDPRPFYSALAHLTNLQAITAGLWTRGAVPTLAALTKLTSVYGEWVAEDQGWDGEGVCEQVVQVRGLGGVPFRAFPNVEVVGLAGSMDAASLVVLGSCCPKLIEIVHVASAHTTWPCFPSTATGPERVAAIKGLGQLTSLTKLTFNTCHKLEVAALANAMQLVTAVTCRLAAAGCGVVF
mgnify:CR=1 FL=1